MTWVWKLLATLSMKFTFFCQLTEWRLPKFGYPIHNLSLWTFYLCFFFRIAFGSRDASVMELDIVEHFEEQIILKPQTELQEIEVNVPLLIEWHNPTLVGALFVSGKFSQGAVFPKGENSNKKSFQRTPFRCAVFLEKEFPRVQRS